MKTGDLVKLILKDGAISVDIGIILGNDGRIGVWKHVFINGKTVLINILDYSMEVINESR
tara:strand:- start:1583 stop:1762 length:180 start_codon:yes stop_codon:yes gene_type:complete